MAKTGFWLKGAKGKLAGTTLYKDPTTGETIMREIVTPANPKTDKQLMQRVIMHTVGASYALMKEICDHSFEGQKAGRETMSYYMQQNIQFCRQQVAAMVNEGLNYYEIFNFIKLGVKGFVPNQYQLSMGSLPQVDAAMYNYPLDGVQSVVKCIVAAVKGNSYQEVIDALGLQRGDQLTFMIIRQKGLNMAQFHFARVILDPTDPATNTPLPLSTEFLAADGSINCPSVRNEGNFKFEINPTDGLIFEPVSKNGGVISAGAVIVSRKVGDKWNRSNAFLAYAEGSFGVSIGTAVDAAKEGVQSSLYAPNELYLNNAGEGGNATEGTSEQGGGSTPVATVQSCLVDNNSAIRGTKKVITKPNGASFPAAIVVDGTAANADGKTVTIVKVSDNSVLASGVVADGEFVINANAAKDTDYAVKLDGAATGFTFRIEEAAAQGGGGSNSPAILTANFAGTTLSAGSMASSTSLSGTLSGTTQHASGNYISVRDADNDTEVASDPITNNAFNVSVSALQEGHNYRLYIVDEEDQKLTNIVWGWTIGEDED